MLLLSFLFFGFSIEPQARCVERPVDTCPDFAQLPGRISQVGNILVGQAAGDFAASAHRGSNEQDRGASIIVDNRPGQTSTRGSTTSRL